MSFLCIDIGATNTKIGVGTKDFKRTKTIDTAEFLDGAVSILNEFSSSEIELYGIASPGPISEKRSVINPPNLPKKSIDPEDQIPMEPKNYFLINDCNAGAVGEYIFGNDETSNLTYISISSGIGGGLILEGNLINGRNGNFCEIGHITVGESQKCGCGGRGHWEAYCSGNNLPKLAKDLTGEKFESAKEIFSKLEKRNKKAVKTIEKMREYNAKGIGNVINNFNPETIVFGGSVAINHPDEVVKGLEEEIKNYTLQEELPEINISTLGEDSVLYGLLALCKVKKDKKIERFQRASIIDLK